MSPDALLFDMDGVLLQGYHTDRDVYRQAVAATLADFGVEYEGHPPPDLVDPSAISDIRAICDDLGLPPSPVWAYRERAATTIENEHIAAADRQPFADTSVLDTLAASYDLAVVSNNRQGTVRFVADYFEWPFEVVRGRFPTLEAYGSLKPDPTMVEWTLDRLGTDDAVYVGDRMSDVTAAHRAGIDVALLTREGDPPVGEYDPHVHVDTLSALPDALDGL